MFGYIRVLEGELKINDFGIYRGVYCGICKSMNRNTGKTSPLTLTYDFVLLALLRSGISGEGFTVRSGKCIAHPLKKRPVAKENEAIRYCTAVSAVLTYYKLLDDKNDKDAGVKKALIAPALKQAKRNLKRAYRAFPEYDLTSLAEKIKEHLDSLLQLEQSKCDSCDQCADKFGVLLSECFACGIKDSDTQALCSEIGYHIGRWIYLIDLCDDFEKDKKRGSFNPLICAGYTELPEMMLRATLARETEMTYIALKKINIQCGDIYRILENIICFGMPNAVNKVFTKDKDNDQTPKGIYLNAK